VDVRSVCVGTEIGEEFGDVRPLTATLQKVLRTNYACLVELIDTSTSGLVSRLTDVGVITGQWRRRRRRRRHRGRQVPKVKYFAR